MRYATVALIQKGNIKKGVETDVEGNYMFSDILPGNYHIEASFVGYESKGRSFKVESCQSNYLDISIKQGTLITELNCPAYKPPMINFSDASSGKTIDFTDIKNMAIPK